MLDRERPDAVNLIVPAPVMAALAERILRRGIPLLMEKPPGLNGSEVRRLIRAASRAGTPHMVAFNRRFLPLVARLRACLEEEFRPGQIRYIRYELVRVARTEPDFSDTAVHAVDTARFIAGSAYQEARIVYHELPEAGRGVANIFLNGRFESGARFSIEVCPTAGAVLERAEVHLDGHSFILHIPIWNQFDAPGRLLHLADGRPVLDLDGAGLAGGADVYLTGGFYAETSRFFDDIRAGCAPTADLASSLQSVQIMHCIHSRARSYRG
jgi:predicted dehydrogenase